MNARIQLPAQLTPEAISHARLRVWATDIRDGKPPYKVHAAAAGWAARLCDVLNTIDDLRQGRRDRQDFHVTVDMLLARLAECGLRPPN